MSFLWGTTVKGPMKEPLIPWPSDKLWSEANRAIHHVCQQQHHTLKMARKHAFQIQRHLLSIFPEMDVLCRNTCVTCKEPCCSVAKLWYDFKDLIFLNITETPIPNAQPINSYRDVCRYLGPKGCILDRISRPWICTHYICYSQTAYLRTYDPLRLRKMDACLFKIKQFRNGLEAEFIAATT